jgi:hypothetical protein
VSGQWSASKASWLACDAGLAGGELVGLGAGFDDVGVEGDAVDDGSDEARLGEHGSPFAERQVRADGDGGSFFSFGDDLAEQFGAARVELDIAELVEQEQVEAAVAADDAGQLPLVGGSGELVTQLGGGGVADPAALLAGGQARADEQMGLGGAGVPEQDDRLAGVDPRPAAKVARVAAMSGMASGLKSASRLMRGKRASAMRRVRPGTAPKYSNASTWPSRNASCAWVANAT